MRLKARMVLSLERRGLLVWDLVQAGSWLSEKGVAVREQPMQARAQLVAVERLEQIDTFSLRHMRRRQIDPLISHGASPRATIA